MKDFNYIISFEIIKKAYIICFLFLISTAQGANKIDFNIIDYNIKADYNADTHQLRVHLQMKVDKLDSHNVDLMFTHFARIYSLYLQASGNTKIKVNSKWISQDSISLLLPDNIDISKKQNIIFDYFLPVDSVSDSRSFVHSFTRPGKWYPLAYNQLSTHSLTISVPVTYSTISTGNLTTLKVKSQKKTYSWYDNHNFTCSLFLFPSDSIKFIKRQMENTALNFFFYSQDTVVQQNYMSVVSESFKYFNNFFGSDYPYKSYTFFEIPDYPAGSAMGSLQVFGTTMIADFYSYGKLYALKPAAHEVAHEWWGIGGIHYKDKTNEKGLQFLRESVNEYLTFRFIENYWGNDSLMKCLDLANAYYREYITDSNEKLIFDIPQQFTTWEEAVIVYYKGPLIVHELRKLMGNENWEIFIKQFYSMNKNKYATYDDFIKTLSVFDKNGIVANSLYQYINTKGFKRNY
jgi:hypothetical protein